MLGSQWGAEPTFRDAHWCRVAKGLAEVALDLVLGRDVELLEQLGRHGHTADSADLVQVIALAELIVVSGVIALILLEILFVSSHCDGAVGGFCSWSMSGIV